MAHQCLKCPHVSENVQACLRLLNGNGAGTVCQQGFLASSDGNCARTVKRVHCVDSFRLEAGRCEFCAKKLCDVVIQTLSEAGSHAEMVFGRECWAGSDSGCGGSATRLTEHTCMQWGVRGLPRG